MISDILQKGGDLIMNKRITRLKSMLLKLGPMHPGSITRQYSTCGKLRCKCKDPKNPVKHGPYYKLSYTAGRDNSTVFIRSSKLAEAKRRIKEYHKFKKLNVDLVKAYVDLAKKEDL